LAVAYFTAGTNDMASWKIFAKVISATGFTEIYTMNFHYNHPALVSAILNVFYWIENNTGLSFAFLFRGFTSLADYAGLFILWEILKLNKVPKAEWVILFCALDPVHFLVSSFHGNTDPWFVFLILMAVYFFETERLLMSGLFFGLSLCVKIVPIILLPAFLFLLPGKKIRFLLGVAIFPLSTYVPIFLLQPSAVLNSIFLYGGVPGKWGIGLLLMEVMNLLPFQSDAQMMLSRIFDFHYQWGIWLYFAVHFILFLYLKKRNFLPSLLGCIYLSFALFFILAGGFGLQYLSWISLFAIAAAPAWGASLSGFAGLFLFEIYARWSGSPRLGFANAYAHRFSSWNSTLTGEEKAFALFLWGFIALMFFTYCTRLSKNTSEPISTN
jgi:Gpi18-like mannosyltransferase